MNHKALLIAVFLQAHAHAQSSKECELIQQRISGTGNINQLCRAIFEECTKKEPDKPSTKEKQDQCAGYFGDCQMAGQLSGDDLQRVKDQYKKSCEP
jgi:hypothetical protein